MLCTCRNIISALISIFTQIKGVYCDGQFSLHGAYLYLTVIQFISLSIILCALFTYLSIFNNEWKDGNIRAHGMFWCVKGPIMFIFYCGDCLLALLGYMKVIKDKPPSSPGGTYWTSEAVKNGYYVLIICSCMAVVGILMQIYFGLDAKEYQTEEADMNYFEALSDGFLAYIPQFVKNVFMCGGDTVVLAKKRIRLRKERRLSDDEHNLLSPRENDLDTATMIHSGSSIHEYLSQPAPSLQNTKLYDEDSRYSKQPYHNLDALPLEPLNATKPVTNSNPFDDTHRVESTTSARSSSLHTSTEVVNLEVQQQVQSPHISLPPPRVQSRVINHNDEISLDSITTGSNYFTPHDLERR